MGSGFGLYFPRLASSNRADPQIVTANAGVASDRFGVTIGSTSGWLVANVSGAGCGTIASGIAKALVAINLDNGKGSAQLGTSTVFGGCDC